MCSSLAANKLGITEGYGALRRGFGVVAFGLINLCWETMYAIWTSACSPAPGLGAAAEAEQSWGASRWAAVPVGVAEVAGATCRCGPAHHNNSTLADQAAI